MAKEITKLTPTQRDVFWGEFTKGDYRYKSDGSRARVMGGAFHRMVDSLRAAGLWGSGYGGRGDATPIQLRHGPTAAGARLWLAQERPSLISKEARANAEARIAQWEQLNAENEARLQREREEAKAQAERTRIAERARLAVRMHELGDEFGLPIGEWPEDRIVEFATRVGDAIFSS